MSGRTVAIVGAGLAGSRCAERLRARGFDGRIVLLGEEPTPPYERPALSKELLLGTRRPRELMLRPHPFWAEHGIELRLGERVARVLPGRRLLVTAHGEELRWNAVVLATGARARQLESVPNGTGVHVLRTLADALRLRQALRPERRIAIVGAGFVGTECASTATALGADVVLIDPAETPLCRAVGPEVGRILAERYAAHGVDLRFGRTVVGVRRDSSGRPRALALDAGDEVACDAVLVGVGADPAADLWGGGPIPTDAAGRTAVRGVYACGDVAAPWSTRAGGHRRIEHWTAAARQGAVVADAILDLAPAAEGPEYVWSDQFGLRLQLVGRTDGAAAVDVEGGDDSFSARYLDRSGSVLGALAANRPRDVASLRRSLAA